MPIRPWSGALLIATFAACSSYHGAPAADSGKRGPTTGDAADPIDQRDARPADSAARDAGSPAPDTGTARHDAAAALDAAGSSDAGGHDAAAALDGGGRDAGGHDAGFDSGPFDAGHDTGTPDAGHDTGTPDAALQGDNPVERENSRPGTAGWQLSNPAVAREIEGYASQTSVNHGARIDLYVSTTSASYTIQIYRLGWYSGVGARSVLGPQTRSGIAQVMPVAGSDGMIECQWTDPFHVDVPNTWTTGIYLAKLTTADSGKQAYITFVVRDDASTSDYLVQSSVTTFQAYNNWGGKSLYDFNSANEQRARRVSFHRPYGAGLNPEAAGGIGAGEVLTTVQAKAQSPAPAWEYSMVRFLEREGSDITYATNIDLHRDPALLNAHKVFVSVGHDEYWSWEMRRNVEDARDRRGLNVAFFSGNAVYWQIRFEPESGADALTRMVCFKDVDDPLFSTADEYRASVRWTAPPLLHSETAITGLTLQDFGIYADVVVDDPDHWIFAGSGLVKGDHLPGLLGYEVDGIPARAAGIMRLARSPWVSPQGQGAADMVTFSVPNGAETFAAGSIQFAWGVDDYRTPGAVGSAAANGAAQQMVRNTLQRFVTARAPVDPTPLVLSETFSTPRDPARWQVGSMNEGATAYDPAVTASVVNGRLEVHPLASATGIHHAGFVSKAPLDLNAAAVSVEVVQGTSSSSAANTTFAIGFDAGNFYRFTLESGALVLQRHNQGNVSGFNISYNPSLHRFWRLRHDEPSSTMYWETSSDGANWVTRRSQNVTVPLDALYIELEAGTYQAETDPGVASFDNLQVQLSGMSDSFVGARNPQHFSPGVLHVGPAAYDGNLIVFTHGGQLHLRPLVSAAGAHFGGFLSTRSWNFEGAAASVEVVQVAAGEALTILAVSLSDQDYARFVTRAGNLHAESSAGGVVSEVSLPYNAVAHRFWRIEHDSTSHELVWKTSPDNTNWTERRRIATAIAWQSARPELVGGTQTPEPTPGEIVFDNFRLSR